jgi:hypothetical protein
MGEQAGVVRLGRRRPVNPEAIGEPARDQRAVQAVLEREAHPEVGGQAECADHLGGTNSLMLRCFGRHRLNGNRVRDGHFRVVPDGEPAYLASP